MSDRPTKRITVSARDSDEQLLSEIMAAGHARSVSAAFRFLCDAYRKMQSDQTLIDVTRRIDHREILQGVGLADDASPPPSDGRRWTALVDED